MITGTRDFRVMQTVSSLSGEVWEVVRYKNSYYARFRAISPSTGEAVLYSDTGPYSTEHEACQWIEEAHN